MEESKLDFEFFEGAARQSARVLITEIAQHLMSRGEEATGQKVYALQKELVSVLRELGLPDPKPIHHPEK